MKLLDIQAAIGTAILLLSLPCDAKHSHQLQHLEIMGKRHDHNKIHASPRAEGIGEVFKKRATCEFPSNAGLVAVTPGSSNAGWAMSPDQQCTAGSYCPFACPPGQVMAQWNPKATSYVYPLSMVCLYA
jgi:formate hydrogenlyase subunit 6/NADH:ubiquinone oxidoreductase subunit I